jgi:D-arginine dehydrogenase
MTDAFDVVVVGGGMAGASIGAAVAQYTSVAVLEQEHDVGMHSTGRSAAVYLQSYGPAGVRSLTKASERPLSAIDEISGAPYLSPRPMVMIAEPGRECALQTELEVNDALSTFGIEDALRLAPMLRPERVGAAAIDDSSADIDVESLLRRYLRQLRALGGELRRDSALTSARWSNGSWMVDTALGSLRTPILINAAGAWADTVATRCGVAPLGLVPRRRTVAIARAAVPTTGPMVVDVDELWYFKPEPGGLLISPADATDMTACDPRPEELDVALAIERINNVTTLKLRSISHAWAGLRTFSPDGDIVLGRDQEMPSFVWACGQGGYGIQSAPAAASYVARLLFPDGDIEPELSVLVSPERIHRTSSG